MNNKDLNYLTITDLNIPEIIIDSFADTQVVDMLLYRNPNSSIECNLNVVRLSETLIKNTKKFNYT